MYTFEKSSCIIAKFTTSCSNRMSNFTIRKGCIVFLIAGALSGFSSIAMATPWTFTQSGTIRMGTDETGRFFEPNAVLDGKTFSISYELDPELYPSKWRAEDPHINARYGAYAGDLKIVVAIDNVSRSFLLDPTRYSSGGSELYNYVTSGVVGADQAKQVHTGFTADGIYVDASTYVYSRSNPFNISLNFEQNWEYVVRPGDFASSGITIGNRAGYTQFFGDFSGLTFKISASKPAQMPEPTSLSMIAFGLLGLLTMHCGKLLAK
jgi:hypothetical protein